MNHTLLKRVCSIIGFAMAGIFVMAVWGRLVQVGGPIGGWAAAIIIVAPFWYLNHYLNLTNQDPTAAAVDISAAISIAGIFRDTFIQGISALISSLPTIAFVAIGSIIGGLLAAAIQNVWDEENN